MKPTPPDVYTFTTPQKTANEKFTTGTSAGNIALPRGYRILAPGELDAETLEKAASYAKLWLEEWAADLISTRDAYIDAKKSGRMAGRRIEPKLASAFAKQFHERADAVDSCAPSLASAIRSLKGGSE
jgi:hypothetical protein